MHWRNGAKENNEEMEQMNRTRKEKWKEEKQAENRR
jgi:hypothetical protein